MEELSYSISGIVSSIVASLLVHPLETLRVKAQSDQIGTTVALKALFKQGGVKVFYNGLGSTIFLNSVIQATYNFMYKFMQKRIRAYKRDLNTLDIIKSSFAASIVAIFVSTPFQVISTRQIQSQIKISALALVNQIIINEGVLALYNGFAPSLLLASNPVIQYSLYENLKLRFIQKDSSAAINFVLGAISKLISTTITFPIITIRTIQMLGGQEQQNVGQLIYQILTKQGFTGFYRGMSSKLLQTVLNSAIVLTISDKLSVIVRRSLEEIIKK